MKLEDVLREFISKMENEQSELCKWMKWKIHCVLAETLQRCFSSLALFLLIRLHKRIWMCDSMRVTYSKNNPLQIPTRTHLTQSMARCSDTDRIPVHIVAHARI